MLVFVLILIIAVLALILYAKGWSDREGKKFELVNIAAKKSYRSSAPVDIPSGTTAAASRFFEVYGTAAKKYDSINVPVVYAGYVQLNDTEVVVAAIRHHAGLTVVTHEPPIKFGDDFVSLMHKSAFIKQLLQTYSDNYNPAHGKEKLVPGNRRTGIVRLREWLENETSWRHAANVSDSEILNLRQLILGDAVSGELRYPKVTSIPDEILCINNLEDLHLQNNNLKSLPAIISDITSLKKLRLGANELTELPATIGKLRNLELLTVWSNELTALPEEIGALAKLKALNISHNANLNKLPASIVLLSELKEFDWWGPGEKEFTEEQIVWLKALRANGCDIGLNDNGVFEN